MTIARISALALTLLILAAVACSSEGTAEPSQTSPPQATSAQPTTAPEPTSTPVASVAPTAAPSPANAPVASVEPTATAEPEEQDLEIVTLLPFDAIPAVLDPVFISAEEADAKLAELDDNPDDALVLGVSIEGDSRAYYIPTLSRVEIVNDTVGGQPLAVTW